MNDKQIKEFIDYIGLVYLDFQNNGKGYRDSVKKDLTERLKKYKTSIIIENEDMRNYLVDTLICGIDIETLKSRVDIIKKHKKTK